MQEEPREWQRAEKKPGGVCAEMLILVVSRSKESGEDMQWREAGLEEGEGR